MKLNQLQKSVYYLLTTSMLQQSFPLHENQRQFYQENQNEKSFDQFQSAVQRQINLHDFDVSQTIAKNHEKDVKCQEEKPFANFFAGAYQQGYAANQIIYETVQFDLIHSNNNLFNGDHTDFHQSSRKGFEAETRSKLTKKSIQAKVNRIARMVLEFDVVRIQILDYIGQIKQKLARQFKENTEKWIENINRNQKHFQRILQAEVDKSQKLEQQIQMQLGRIEELQFAKHNLSLEQVRLKQKIEELQQEISHLNNQISLLSTQNEDLKFDLIKAHEYQNKIIQYENQLHNLSVNLEQNNQYIFDLQQKIANSNFEFNQKEQYLKRQYEMSLQHQKEKMEHQFTVQFQKIQQDIKEKVMEQLYNQYKLSMENLAKEHKLQVEELKHQLEEQGKRIEDYRIHHQNQICHLQQQKIGLIQQIKNYQAKLHQFQQIQMMKKPKSKQDNRLKIEELSIKLREFEDKCKDKDAQIQYYKSIRSQAQDSVINCRPKKPSNMLAMDESILDKSIRKQSAISPSSAAINQKYGNGKPRQVLINNILSRIRMKQEGSVISQIHQNSFETKNSLQSTLRPVSPESMLLQKQKDARMKNISSKLQQLRSDIRRQIGMMKS